MTTINVAQNKMLILDFGSQYTQLIARRVREQRVYCEIHPCNLSLEKIQAFAPSGVIFSGGPMGVYADDAPTCDVGLLDLGVPILGICYGLQLIAKMESGEVSRSKRREYGRARLLITDADDLFAGFPVGEPVDVWMSHGDKVDQLPPGYQVLATSANSPNAAVADRQRKIFGVQFHPEVAHTPRGDAILANFLFHICGCKPDWTMSSFVERSVDELRRHIGNEEVLCALSGGVDSSVVATLLHRAIGKQLHCIFVDNGLIRKGEAESVKEVFGRHFGMELTMVDAADRFLEGLAGVTEPERKRKIIGELFIRVFEEQAHRFQRARFLAQGTLYPDVIESRSVRGPSATIKSHHNVGGLPERMHLSLIEPLKELFKDEVRLVGETLGLPHSIIHRHPFPGPGLGVRVIGAITRARCDVLREADAILQEELVSSGQLSQTWQTFAVLLPVRSVGVMGDERTYDETVVIRAVTSLDGMTADWARLPYDFLALVSNRIINEVKGVNRVLYDISSKPPATIEWE
jgi:GMP synthase (glutamine-hydrolysing)